MHKQLRLGLVQARTPTDPEAAWAHIAALIQSAASAGAQLIATPEFSNTCDTNPRRLHTLALAQEDDSFLREASTLARELRIWLLIGSVIVREPSGRLANRSVLFNDKGELQAAYDKIHMFAQTLPDGRRVDEAAAFRPGEHAVCADTPWGRLGLTICYDLRFPYLFRTLAQQGARMIAAPAAFTQPTGKAHWDILLRARAIETGAYILAPAQGGAHEGGRATWGHSMIVGPWGEIVQSKPDMEPGVLIADLDFAACDEARARMNAWAATPFERSNEVMRQENKDAAKLPLT